MQSNDLFHRESCLGCHVFKVRSRLGSVPYGNAHCLGRADWKVDALLCERQQSVGQ
jgi:hypothetical protein